MKDTTKALLVVMVVMVVIVIAILTAKVLMLEGKLETSKPIVAEPNKPPPITAHVFPANETWKNAYGDNDNTVIFFNLKVLTELIRKTNARVRALEDPNGITK